MCSGFSHWLWLVLHVHEQALQSWLITISYCCHQRANARANAIITIQSKDFIDTCNLMQALWESLVYNLNKTRMVHEPEGSTAQLDGLVIVCMQCIQFGGLHVGGLVICTYYLLKGTLDDSFEQFHICSLPIN